MAQKKIELANPNGCLNRAADDEPIFVLRAHDRDASTVVRVWALRYRQRKVREAAYDERADRKYDEAQALAKQMDDWLENHK
jgi:hypothetical protein